MYEDFEDTLRANSNSTVSTLYMPLYMRIRGSKMQKAAHTSIYKIPKKEIIRVRRLPPNLKQLHQIIMLAVDVAADLPKSR